MSAQTYEWDGETTTSQYGDLVVGPWQDELAEPVVVIDRRELMAGRPGAVSRHESVHDRFWDVAVMATVAVMIIGVILSLGRLGQVWQGNSESGHVDSAAVVRMGGYQSGDLPDVRS
ncbi:hypothetical protein O6R08_04595 [Cutibacterium equinum]|uniref:Tat pathway signal sequence domain protein n=1 Tax=Cutibacterium equinum TaxID=3016342 RepID=A0ABY7R1W4_9ACTN|nr:hypothetical protein [Cutibacterium equinum]WCC80757.1 hypothetical protein O6R08_04595 [Cutibacterium equinum]